MADYATMGSCHCWVAAPIDVTVLNGAALISIAFATVEVRSFALIYWALLTVDESRGSTTAIV